MAGAKMHQNTSEAVMSDINICTCTEEDRKRWDWFVNGHPECTSYHRWAWKHVFEAVFGWPGIYLLAEQGGQVRGILPLIRQKCLLRSYLSSMPHLQAGGIVADNHEIEQVLFETAVGIARRTHATYLELRHDRQHDLPVVLRQDKVGAILPIEEDSRERLLRLDKKTRNGVRKSLRFDMTAEFGRFDLLPEFYQIYRHNMHDLGSPAYSLSFFTEILNSFPNESCISVARLDGKEVAAAFLIGFRNMLEVAWASSYRQYRNLNPNMFLYWNILEFAADRNYKFLDFGRSTRDSGTYEFKKRWGAEPHSLYWSYWMNRKSDIPEVRTGGMQMVSHIWQRLPESFTNVIGPALIRHIHGI
jgi:serine/alanine adding enzyme